MLVIAWLRVRVARYTHPVYSPSGSCHSDVTSLPPLYLYPLSIAWLRVRFARYTFLFSLAWPWRMKSLVKHNMLKTLSRFPASSFLAFFEPRCSYYILRAFLDLLFRSIGLHFLHIHNMMIAIHKTYSELIYNSSVVFLKFHLAYIGKGQIYSWEKKWS